VILLTRIIGRMEARGWTDILRRLIILLNLLQRFFGVRPPGTAVSPLRDSVSQLPFFPAEFFA
jgi:hypothetical protein